MPSVATNFSSRGVAPYLVHPETDILYGSNTFDGPGGVGDAGGTESSGGPTALKITMFITCYSLSDLGARLQFLSPLLASSKLSTKQLQSIDHRAGPRWSSPKMVKIVVTVRTAPSTYLGWPTSRRLKQCTAK